jgi:5-methylcytosine-specific restriction endonuclease McrA
VDSKEYHSAYQTAEWKRLRKAQLRSQPLCVMCLARGFVKTATVVDHIQPWRGDKTLFRDPDNLQSLCFKDHNTHKRTIENKGYSSETDMMGYFIDPKHPSNQPRPT